MTESQRVEARMLKGVVSAQKIARTLGVTIRAVRYAWDPEKERLRERAYQQRARERYRARKHVVQVKVRDRYQGPGDGNEGTSARCPRCGRVYTAHDFRTDVITGLVIEPTVCWRCLS